jgi:glucose/arabinose dehydrogenase
MASITAAAWLAVNPALAADAPALKLEKGDRVAIIGNTLADRMQHDGWLEAYIQSRFPEQEIVIRNLGYSADEVDPNVEEKTADGKFKQSPVRLRSKNFGSPDNWLKNTAADVVFAFYGYSESWAGEKGVSKFKEQLAGQLKAMQAKPYGKAAARIVLFSPIAFENTKDANLPDGAKQNQNLKLYTAAMADVAKAANVAFVDLFTPTQELYAKAAKPLTINGVHLTDEGNRQLAELIDKALFAATGAAPDASKLDKVRKAVLDKNFFWFHRYRTTDGYSTYGDRAFLKFVDGQTNYDVMQRELQVLDVMTANRDKVVWAAAQGKTLAPDDSNTLDFIPVKTNKPGKGPDGKHVFLSGEEAIGRMKIGQGLKVSLFADEKMFPVLNKPVQMAFDTKGRLWVAAWPSYPHWRPKDEMNDKLLILEDTDNDGKADKCTVFADKLHNPTGFEFYNGGVIVAMVPDILFLKDTDGDDNADVRDRIVSGMDSADTHHSANSFTFDPGGALYWQEGTFHHSQAETPWGPAERLINAGVWRFEPRTHKLEVYAPWSFANPHGHVFDKWGADIVHDGTGAQPYYGPSFSGKTYYPAKRGKGAPVVYKQRTRPCPGTEILSSSHFPERFNGNLMVPNVIGFQGILNYKLDEKGAGIVGKEVEPIVSSDDPNFRPSDVEVGPDGALWFTDWQNPIIGHMQHNLRDPSRDHVHGRVYRVTAEGRPLLKAPKIAGASVDELLENLKSPEDRVRYRSKIELSGRDSKQVVVAAQKWAAGLDKADKNYDHQLTEALWVHQWHNAVNEDLLNRVLKSKEANARAAAVRVLCYWRDRVKAPLDLLKTAAVDDSPRVRLEAVRACSFFTDPRAMEIALESVNKPQDEFLKYTLDETMKTLEKVAK